ncbi:MAG: family 43 glycosylhydrolase [Deltaproteobacteria bacterium]|nr:family 43 glycosylhydrolase [Deltaproteobacteria bacterium]
MPPERTRLINGQFTADPSAHVFDCKLWFFPSHDQDNASGFNMVDYHAFSLGEDGSFKDEGQILHLNDVPWASQYAWAPDIAYKNNKYFFYFPAKDNSGVFHMGVAIADSPAGPYKAEAQPMPDSFSIDPAVFVDDDGKAYMYFGGQWGGQLECYNSGSYNKSDCSDDNGNGGSGDGKPRVAQLADNMKEFSGGVKEVNLTGSPQRFFEGSWVHKYDGKYYFSYSDGPNHQLHYAMGDSPMGPFTYKGVLLPDHGQGWTTHHSVLEFQGKWYLFYHDSACSNGNTNQRCVKYASLSYNADGTIQRVQP